jgi:hypothetical protein
MSLVLKKILLLFLLCLFTIIKPAFSQKTFVFKGKKQKELLTFTKARGLMILSTYINNKGPFNFILDTGVGLTIITDPKLKDSLDLKNLRKIKVTGLGEGKDIDAFVSSFIKIEIGSTIAESTSAAILDEDIFDLSNYAGMPIHGLIGYEFFSSFVVRINYQLDYLNIYNNAKPRIFKKGNKIPIIIEQNKPYVEVFVDVGKKKKIPVKMLIDTGAGHPISLESRNGSAFPLPDKFISANLGVGLGGNISGYIGRIENFKIGKFDVKNPICSFPYYEDVGAKAITKRSGSIGNQLLKRFQVIFDYQKSTMYLRPNANFRDPFEHDMSGIELFVTADKRYFINRIERQSPADEMGLKKDDEILSINFKPTNQMAIDEVTETLKSKDDRNLILEIRRIDEIFSVLITLKRRI